MEAHGKYARPDIHAEEVERLLGSAAPFEAETMEHQSNAGGSSRPSIPSIPDKLRKLNESAYSPRIVSIGPINKNDEHLKKMESCKEMYKRRLFERTTKSGVEDECTDAMVRMVPVALTYYEASFQPEENEFPKFAKMLLLDGCFILEFLYAFQGKRNGLGPAFNDDPILGNILVLVDMRRDLLLLENQIPFFALQKLFQLTVEQIPNRHAKLRLSLNEFIREFFGNMMNSNPGIEKKDVSGDHHYHILDLLLKCYLPCRGEPSDHPITICAPTKLDGAGVNFKMDKKVGPSGHPITATELHRAGVSFHVSKEVDLDVEFNTSCWLCGDRPPSKIPKNCIYHPNDRSCCCLFSWLCLLFGRTRFTITPISINDETELILRNLIAFEQCSPDYNRTGFHITSYAFLMDSLINSEGDVELLEKAGVLQNSLGASEDAKHLFNNICKEIVVENYFSKQCNDAQEYCKNYWPKTLASLRANYFNNPWAIISVIAALILFGLAVVQTYYSIHSSSAFLGLGSLLKYMQ